MTPSNRKPGRPRGSGINDGRDLDAVADLIVRKPELKKTPAISRIVQERHPDRQHQWPAIERRLLRKWNHTAQARLSAAQERREERRSQTYRPAPYYGPSSAATALDVIEHGSAFLRGLEAAGSMSRLEDSLAIGGIAAGAGSYLESIAIQGTLRSIQEDAVRWASIGGVVDAARELAASGAIQGAMHEALGHAERLRRFHDQVDPLRSKRGLFGP